jgi:hypothetical protein
VCVCVCVCVGRGHSLFCVHDKQACAVSAIVPVVQALVCYEPNERADAFLAALGAAKTFAHEAKVRSVCQRSMTAYTYATLVAVQILLFKSCLDKHDVSVKLPRPSTMAAPSADGSLEALQAAIALSAEMVDD